VSKINTSTKNVVSEQENKAQKKSLALMVVLDKQTKKKTNRNKTLQHHCRSVNITNSSNEQKAQCSPITARRSAQCTTCCKQRWTFDGRTKLTTLATVDVPWRKKAEKFSQLQSLGQICEGSNLIFEKTEFNYNAI